VECDQCHVLHRKRWLAQLPSNWRNYISASSNHQHLCPDLVSWGVAVTCLKRGMAGEMCEWSCARGAHRTRWGGRLACPQLLIDGLPPQNMP
jgi:hypothetical protein